MSKGNPRVTSAHLRATLAVQPNARHTNVDDIISYAQLVHAEGANLQKGMNFGIGRN